MAWFKLFHRESYEPPLSRRQILKSLTSATLVACALSSVAAYGCMSLAGAGHGANSPLCLFFGPVLAYWQLVPYDGARFARYLLLTVSILFVYYSLYGFVISLGRIWGRGRLAMALVFAFHYGGVMICVMSDAWDGIRNLDIVAMLWGGFLIIFMVELFITLHLLAFQFAGSPLPYRIRWTRPVVVILSCGLAIGFALEVYVLAGSPYY